MTVHNWMAYRGEQTIELQPKVYAVTAARLGDPERSNWNGKSALFEAIDFALTGRLNPDRHIDANGWISDGEKEGYVELETDDHQVIKRARKLGKSTQLTIDGKKKGDEAEQHIIVGMGMTPEDYSTICYFRQRQMAKFILAKPEERMSFVRAWLRLAQLEAAEARVGSHIRVISDGVENIRVRVQASLEAEHRMLHGYTEQQLQEAIESEKKRLVKVTDKYERLQEVLVQNAELERAHRFVEGYEKLHRESQDVVQFLSALDGKVATVQQAADLRDKLHAEMYVALRDVEQKETLARGQFDGKCPVAGISCPATVEINLQTMMNNELLSAARVVFTTKQKAYEHALADFQAKNREHQDALLQAKTLEKARAYVQSMHDEYQQAKKKAPPADAADLRDRVRIAAQEQHSCTTSIQAMEHTLQEVARERQSRIEWEKDLAEADKKIAVLREAYVLFGKQGAQRRVAEGALKRIEQRANDSLRECGINLDVEIVWSREGSGPAKTCDSCGTPFPSSRTVKQCAVCKAERGPLLINKLDIALSDQSGAAEDLAGIAIQLSASAWLRAKRAAKWAAAFIDEPFAHLDRAHSQQLSAHLATLLSSRYAFEQALVISHSTAAASMLPGQIVIENDGKWSKMRVAA